MTENSEQPALNILHRFDFAEGKKPAPMVMEFVKAARLFAGISKSELAKRSGISQGHTSDYENYGYLPKNRTKGVSLRILITIAHTCGLNLAVIVGPKNTGKDSEKSLMFSINEPFLHLCKTGGKIYTTTRNICGEGKSAYAKRLGIDASSIYHREEGVRAGQPILPRLTTLLDTAEKSGCRLSLALCRPEAG